MAHEKTETESAAHTAWFEDESFWDSFAPIMFDEDRWKEVPAVADGILALSGVGKSGSILDMCCGLGRLSTELALRSYTVCGVDITPSYLEAARETAEAASVSIEYVLSDVRSFIRPNSFDLALNLYISFGYFDDPDDDLLFVRNVRSSLRPGSCFIIETLGKEIAVREFTTGECFERAGYSIRTSYECVDSWTGLKNTWHISRDGNSVEKTFVQRLYAASELRRLLLEAGFDSVELYGDWNGQPYDQTARVLIAVARLT